MDLTPLNGFLVMHFREKKQVFRTNKYGVARFYRNEYPVIHVNPQTGAVVRASNGRRYVTDAKGTQRRID